MISPCLEQVAASEADAPGSLKPDRRIAYRNASADDLRQIRLRRPRGPREKHACVSDDVQSAQREVVDAVRERRRARPIGSANGDLSSHLSGIERVHAEKEVSVGVRDRANGIVEEGNAADAHEIHSRPAHRGAGRFVAKHSADGDVRFSETRPHPRARLTSQQQRSGSDRRERRERRDQRLRWHRCLRRYHTNRTPDAARRLNASRSKLRLNS